MKKNNPKPKKIKLNDGSTVSPVSRNIMHFEVQKKNRLIVTKDKSKQIPRKAKYKEKY